MSAADSDRLFAIVLELRAEITSLEAELAGYRSLERVPEEQALRPKRIIRRAPTTMELQLLELLAQGYTKEHIALEVGRSINTVKTHLHRLSKAWGAQNAPHLVAIAKDEEYI